MASKTARRVSQSAVDWARLAAVIPKAQTETLRIIKTKHDNFINRVHQLPENLPKIDFAAYKARLPDPTMADRFQKAYEALNIAYPQDKDHLLDRVEKEREEQEKLIQIYVRRIEENIKTSRLFISKIESLPAFKEMTVETFAYYFPETAVDPERPTFWPHHEEDQPWNQKPEDEHHH